MPDPLIEMQNVDALPEDAAAPVLRGLNWRLAAGECWVVAGDQGTGKTAFLETAAGLMPPGAGRVRIFGKSVAEAREPEHLAWRKRIGFVFEHGGRLLSHLTVADNIALPLMYHGGADEQVAAERAGTLLRDAGLGEVAGLLPSRLSRALQQRVGLLRAVVMPKEVLCVNQPIAPRWWARTLGEMQARAAEAGQPLSLAVTTEDFRAWTKLGTHFALLDQGTLRVVGGREQLLASEDATVREFR